MKILLLAKLNAQNYIDAVRSFGYEPQLVCETLDEVDGVILCGGSDIDPGYYGQEMCGSRDIDKERDEREVPIARECIEKGIPLLGICRGLQMLNVLFGGTLIQHLENEPFHNKPKSDSYITHTVTALEDSVFHKLYGDAFIVNTSHHQAIDHLGEGLIPCLFAPDGVIEGVVHEYLPVLAVQWHPERMMLSFADGKMADGGRIFRAFFEMIEKSKEKKA